MTTRFRLLAVFLALAVVISPIVAFWGGSLVGATAQVTTDPVGGGDGAGATTPTTANGDNPADSGAPPTATEGADGTEPPNSAPPPVPPGLQNASGTVQVLVEFPQADLPPHAREQVVQRRKAHANRTQRPLIGFARERPGVTVRREFWLVNAVLVEVDTDRVPLQALAKIPGVTRLAPNEPVSLPEPPREATGPAPGESTHASGANATTYGLEQIDAPRVWREFDTRGEGVKVAVLDTGVAVTHPDIELYTENASNRTYPGGWAEFNASTGERVEGSKPHDTAFHGTHTSGTVAGGNASGRAIGVAPGVSLMHGLVIPNGTGTTSSVLAGLEWAVEEDADVVSLSLGGGFNETAITAVQNAEAAGTVVVAAIGNSGEGTAGWPGASYEALSVGAVDRNRTVASFSGGGIVNKSKLGDPNGTEDWPEEYVVPDVTGPGVAVTSSVPGKAYMVLDGTSMATPHVAGAAALVLAATNDTPPAPAELRRLLRESAWKPAHCRPSCTPRAGNDTRYGAGVVNAYSAAVLATDEPRLEGTVTDSTTSQAVANVTVTAADGNVTTGATTNATGQYDLAVAGGTYSVTATAFGYTTDQAPVSVTTDGITTQNLSVEPTVAARRGSTRLPAIPAASAYRSRYRVANLENATVTLAAASTVAPADVEVRINGTTVALGETVTFAEPVTTEQFTVTANTSPGARGELALSVSLGGEGAWANRTIGPLPVGEPVDGCREITSPGDYVLDASWSTNVTNCLVIRADDVTLYGNGHVVEGGSNTQRVVYADGTGSTLRNVTVRDVGAVIGELQEDYPPAGEKVAAVTYRHVEGGAIVNSTNNVTISDGFVLRNVTDVEVRESFVGGTWQRPELGGGFLGTDTVLVLDSSGVVVRDNVLRRSAYYQALRVANSTDVSVVDNFFPSTNNGTAVENSTDTVLRGNRFDTGDFGLRIEGASNTTVAHNEVFGPSDPSNNARGIHIIDSTGTDTSANYLIDNRQGIVLHSTDGTTLTDDVSVANLQDLYLAENATGTTVTNLTLPPTVSFEAHAVAISGVTWPPRPPSGYRAIGPSIELASTATVASESHFDATVRYPGAIRGPDSLQSISLWRNVLDTWSEHPASATIDHDRDTIEANVTRFTSDPQVVSPLETPCSNVSSPGHYALYRDMRDFADTSDACILINSSDVVLDGDGHTLDGDEQTIGISVDRSPQISNVTVRNVALSGWETGLRIENGSAVTASRIRASGTEFQGIYVRSSTDVRVADSRLSNNTGDGIVAAGSPHSTVVNVTASSNHVGVNLLGSNHTRVAATVTRNNSYAGVGLLGNVNVTATDLTATGNAYGVLVSRSRDVTVRNATVDRNDRVAPIDTTLPKTAGVVVSKAEDTVVRNASMSDNQGVGALVVNATDTRFDRVRAVGNANWSAHLANGSTRTVADEFRLSATTTVWFRAHDVALGPVPSSPSLPTGGNDVDVYVNATNTSDTSWLHLNASYAESAAAGLNESDLEYWRYDGTWRPVENETLVDPTENEVRANLTGLDGAAVYAPLVVKTHNVTGRLVDERSAGLADDWVIAKGVGEYDISITDASGNWTWTATSDGTYGFTFVQLNETSDLFPRDGVADLDFAAERTITDDADLGTATVPNGHVVNVTVVNESDVPVENATVAVAPDYRDHPDTAAGLTFETTSMGTLHPNPNATAGMELQGNVSIRVRPPEDGTQFVNTTYWRNVTVTAPREITVTLNERESVLSGRLLEADGDNATDDYVTVLPQNDSTLYLGITSSSGRFEETVPTDDTYGLSYVQRNASGALTHRDGTVDLWFLAERYVTNDTDFGVDELPPGHVVNVSVVNESGAPVADAVVTVAPEQYAHNDSLLTSLVYNTTEDGLLDPNSASPPGIELNGSATVTVEPPGGEDAYVDQHYERNLSVDSDREVTVTLEEVEPLNVTTAPATGVNASSATLHGNLTGLGDADSVNLSFVYWVAGDPTNRTEVSVERASSPTTFSAAVSGLEGDTTYAYRARANATNVSDRGDELQFTTSPEGTPLHTEWTFDVGSRVQYASAAVDSERVYVGSLDDTLYALDQDTGTVAWQFNRSGSLVDSSPALHDGRVIVGSGGGTVYALWAANGTVDWSYTDDSAIVSSPVVAGGTVYVGSNDGTVFALSDDTGTVEWTTELGAPVLSTVAFNDSTVYLTTDDGRVVALDATDGSSSWTYDTGTADLGHASPTVADGRVYVAADDVYALDESDGSVLWNTTYGGTAGSTPAHEGDTLYVGSADGDVYALDDSTGAVSWTFATGAAVGATPTTVSDRLVVGSDDGRVYLLDSANGTEVANASTGTVRSAATVDSDVAFVGTWDGTLYALGNVTGG